jgi:hypothetical protein
MMALNHRLKTREVTIMALYTPKLHLKKPEQGDYYNIDDHNENYDKIDAALIIPAMLKVTNATYERLELPDDCFEYIKAQPTGTKIPLQITVQNSLTSTVPSREIRFNIFKGTSTTSLSGNYWIYVKTSVFTGAAYWVEANYPDIIVPDNTSHNTIFNGVIEIGTNYLYAALDSQDLGTLFNTTSGHDHDGTNSKKVSYNSLEPSTRTLKGILRVASVTSAAINRLELPAQDYDYVLTLANPSYTPIEVTVLSTAGTLLSPTAYSAKYRIYRGTSSTVMTQTEGLIKIRRSTYNTGDAPVAVDAVKDATYNDIVGASTYSTFVGALQKLSGSFHISAGLPAAPNISNLFNTSSGHDHDGYNSALLGMSVGRSYNASVDIGMTSSPQTTSIAMVGSDSFTTLDPVMFDIRVVRLGSGTNSSFALGITNASMNAQAVNAFVSGIIDTSANITSVILDIGGKVTLSGGNMPNGSVIKFQIFAHDDSLPSVPATESEADVLARASVCMSGYIMPVATSSMVNITACLAVTSCFRIIPTMS